MNDSLLPRAMLSPTSPPPAPRPFLSFSNPTFSKLVRAENRLALNQGDWCNSLELGFALTRATSDEKFDFFKHNFGSTCKRHDVMNGTFILPTNITHPWRIRGKDEISSWFWKQRFPLQNAKNDIFTDKFHARIHSQVHLSEKLRRLFAQLELREINRSFKNRFEEICFNFDSWFEKKE